MSETKEIIKKYSINENDVGSAQVQIALLSHRISTLSDHLITHRKDNHSRLGLLKMISKRKKLMKYLKARNLKTYQSIISDLKIRG